MNIGVGLPTSTSGISGQLLVDWAKRADAGPFSSLGVLDRVAYQNYEPFTALAAAAAVTGRVRSEEHTSELQSLRHLVCRLLLEKKKTRRNQTRAPPQKGPRTPTSTRR